MFKSWNIKNKVLIISIILGFILFFSLTITLNDSNTISAFNSIQKDTIFEEDLNGDKKKDTILIKNTDQGFIGQVNLNKNKTYGLDPSNELPTLGEYCSYWPIRVSTLDISRDNSKEIFIQSSFNNKPIQQIFSWDGSKYVNILSSTNNLLGFLDSGNSKTPKVISGNIDSVNIDFKEYLYNKGLLKEINNSNNTTLIGEDTITDLISLIHQLPNPYISVPNYFYSQISGSDLESLFRLANGQNSFKFQDGYFIDLAWSENGDITCENWILNFRSTNTKDTSNISTMTINLMLNKYDDEDFPYKITSFNVYQ